MISLFDTMDRTTKKLTPQKKDEVSVYTCGPTVYDHLTIGNWATYVRWDTLMRVMLLDGLNPNWVMNITDVGHLVSDADDGEDKIEKGAKREGKTAWEIAKFYTDEFKKGLQSLNISQPTHLVNATDHIPEQIDLIKRIEAKGYAYVIDDGVYFDTAKLSDYGKLAGLKLDELKAGARVEYNHQKKNPTDFTLWKFTPSGVKRDMQWDSPWGIGAPGWHIECSAMAHKYLGDTLDIHAGGKDHIPVHHTNEIAQSEVATGKPLANIWLHSNFINVDNTRIGKSMGNAITLAEIEANGYSALDLRMLYLQSHYRTPANFTWNGLDAARTRRKNLQAFADLRFQLRDGGLLNATSFNQVKNVMLTELSNDLDTPTALAALSDLLTAAETDLIAPDAKDAFNDFLATLDAALGLQLLASTDITNEQKTLISQREKARAERDFAAADQTRDELLRQGIELRDTPLGTIWTRI